MKADDYDRFVDALNATAEAVGKRHLTELGIGVYWSTLERYEITDITAAISRHLGDPDVGQFMPKPADIVRQIDGSGDERSGKAWAKVERAITQVGPWKPIAFDDPVIHVVVEQMGGLSPFMVATIDDMNILRAWFLKAYRAYRGRPLGRYPSMLWAEGGRRADLVLIGDQDKAQRVLQGGDDGKGQITQASSVANLLADAREAIG